MVYLLLASVILVVFFSNSQPAHGQLTPEMVIEKIRA
jgi:hypothetical protein